ncbi:hypothetical protein HYDPIDRAFT_81594 [Hydnomerulius pinastri MD-312]|nr:hypothetical protein HYDPIDRAFT_81594 [Hydnomerulius pinastri MD-312]
MIIIEPEQPKTKQPGQYVPGGEASSSFSSSSAPPAFEESSGDRIVQDETYAIPGGEEPPAFTPYDASYFASKTGDVISHDPHLNEDGEALYRFLLSQASIPPKIVLRCKGSHNETHTRLVHSHREDGQTRMKTEQYTERIADFDFSIDVGQHIFGEPTHWSVGDSTPAYRGRMFREVGINGEKRKAKRAETKAAKAWDSERNCRGFPPWIGSDYAWREDQPHVMHTNSVLKSSWTLRQWADDYCSSRKHLKEFEYQKVVYGWNFDAIKAATLSVITSTHYRGDLEVEFETTNAVISIRSQNRLSRALSNGWIKFLLIITLIYPFIWLFKRFNSRGGGTWRVCGGAYALKRIEQASPSQDYPDDKFAGSPFRDAQEAFSAYGQASGSSSPPDTQTRVVGLREGVWFKQWEGTIRRAVLNRLCDADPLIVCDDRPAPPALLLDGY